TGGGLAAFSNHFSLGEMVRPTWPGCLGLSSEELEQLLEGDVEVLAWASLAMGYFAGREAPSWETAEKEAPRRRPGGARWEELGEDGPPRSPCHARNGAGYDRACPGAGVHPPPAVQGAAG